jgi:hypothetical protein
VILPASFLYIFIGFFLLRENTLDSMVLGILVFIYANFLPDLPSVFRNKKGEVKTGSLNWFKKYALLLFAPLFIWLLFSDIGIVWKTTDTFHNFKSLIIVEAFLALFGFIAFGGLIESLSFSFYGVIGYLAHLKVDKIW